MDELPQVAGVTIIGGAGRWPRLRLVSDQAKPGDWISGPRREPIPARHRLGPLKAEAWPKR
jgi:hypothetical protein